MEEQLLGTPRMKGSSAPVGSASHLFVEGISPSIKAVERIIQELADSDVPVLLLAEPGSGKKATAERIHQLSNRRGEPFSSLPSSHLIPSSFSNGDSHLNFAGRGTVYLEEVASLNVESQEYLLRCFPHARYDGGTSTITARLICGTSRDLEADVRAGRFREDLYYRISGVTLRLPPLRQRKEDIPQLLSFFLAKYAADFDRPAPVLSSHTQQLFADYTWPGNLRELEDAAKAIVVLGDEALAMGGLRALLVRPDRSNGDRVSLKEAAKAASREAERELILKVLTRTRWNRRRAAQELQISYKALLYKLKQIGYEEFGTS
jgi:two-component system, NtrC family, response regulator AtoC